jgi:hypothetical protein
LRVPFKNMTLAEKQLEHTLLILFVSASLLLQFRISEMKTARPRMPSFATVGMAVVSLKKSGCNFLCPIDSDLRS